VLGPPLTFALSQDQTLQFSFRCKPKLTAILRLKSLMKGSIKSTACVA
jgi:hypothetical protein